MSTTVITDETVTISLRMGATLAMAAIGDGTADIVYTLPGEAEQTDALAGKVERVYGPYPYGQDFEITATDSVQAVTTFGTITANATIQQVDSLPALGAPNVIYQTATAAYWWNGVAFIAMGSGAGGVFTTLAVSGAATIGDSLTVTGALRNNSLGITQNTANGGYWFGQSAPNGSGVYSADGTSIWFRASGQDNLNLTGTGFASIPLQNVAAPVSATAPGVAGTLIRNDSDLYLCFATDQWVKFEGVTF